MDEIAFLTLDNTKQQAKVQHLRSLIQQRLSLFNTVLNSKDRDSVIQISKRAQGVTEQIRALFIAMEKEEKQLMDIRKENLDSSQSFLINVTVWIVIAAFLVLCLLFSLMLIETRRRVKTEEDLVEKKKIIEKIREFEFFADSIPQIIWTARPDGGVDYYNKNWYAYTGLTYEQTKDWNWKHVMHPDDIKPCMEVWLNCLQSGKDYEVEYRLKKAETGEYRWHLDRASAMRNEKGEIVKWFGTCTDIHLKKEEEQKLISSNLHLTRLYETILQSAPYSIISTNTEGIITSYNKASEKQLGYAPEEVIGRVSPAIFHIPEEMALKTKEISAELGYEIPVLSLEFMASLGSRNEREWTHVRKDGSHYPVRLSITALKDEKGMTIGFMGTAIDITSEKENRRLALEKEKQLEAFVTHTPLALAMYDTQLRFITVSNFYLSEQDREAHEFIGKTHQEVFPDNALGEILQNALRGVPSQEIEVELVANPKKGRQWYHLEAHPWYQYDGQVGGVMLMFQNITSKVATLQELKKKNQMLRAITENMSVRMYRFGKDGTILEAMGRGWYDIGVNPETQLIGKNAYTLYPERKAWIDEAFECRDKIELSVNYDVNGQERYFENYVFRDDDSNPDGIIGFALDVTDKKRRELEILENEKRLKSFLESAPDAMVIVNEQERVELINTETKRMFGYAEEELIGLQIENLFSERFAEYYTNLIKTPQDKRIEFELSARRKDGTEFPVEIGLSTVHTKEKILVSASIRDATERQLIQKQLEEAKTAAENANMIKSRFLANMSHEIRTPLNAIIGFADVLAKQEMSKQQKVEYLGYINNSGNLLLRLIGDILDISKIEEGKLELVHESFPFKEVISSAILPYKFSANEKGLEFALRFSENIPNYLIGDPSRIKQVIINLIGNALKFTKEGKITIDVTNMTSNETAEEIKIRFAISDTGIGISTEQHANVFESFTQADNSIIRKFGGTGLGLSIVRQLVTMMGGEIHIISPSNSNAHLGGPGSTFWFSLPYKVDKVRVAPSDIVQDEEKRFSREDRIRVLVVEDNQLNQRLAKIILSNIGCDAMFSDNGQEALDILQRENFSIVFMDVQMPIMDGYEATRKIRKELQLTLPVIGLSANVFKEDIENCLASGMNDYLSKPYNENQMYDIIKKWLHI